ncbi:probable cyclic nucleotide-gated ion channel 14 [Chenopodium quinoa]|uniref:probable cyclic nucleotide-gated ion channel 14 n=1 Tax=Chenopodium quinoa TaxID=63459 RepID=UPI000B772BB5|nr:probable cyclic nucleotide-gated ion channel 14 [Chenopodium quinoa]
MDSKRHKQVSFYENGKQSFNNSYSSWGRNDSFRSEKSSNTAASSTYIQTTPLLSSRGGFGSINRIGSGINRIGGAFKLPTFRAFSRNGGDGPWKQDESWWNRTLDPSSEVVLIWNRIFLVACLVALFVDPLFFYLPEVDKPNGSFCMSRNVPLGAVVTFVRTVADILYMLHVVVRFRTAFVAPSSRVFGRGELVRDRKEISRRYIRSGFFIDLIAALPLPQIVIWFVIPAIKLSKSRSTYNALQLIVFIQYIPRFYLIFPLSAEIIKSAGDVTKTAWAGAAYNLMFYMLASHILGAAWYLVSVERYSACWKSACRHEKAPAECRLKYLDCSTKDDRDRIVWANSTQVFSLCDPNNANSTFEYGIFINAMLKDVVSDNFMDKYFYCLWWGLQQLSSYGQNLESSTFAWETTFCILISIVGLVLFSLLIGNMQTYLQSITLRLEEWRLKRRDTEEWMKHRQLPQHLRVRVRRFVQYKWMATRGVNEEAILTSLPIDLRRDIQSHLCLDLVRRVPFFASMDHQLLDAICERLRSSLNTAGTFIVREGDPVTEMLFIIRGKLDSSTTNGGRSGFFNSILLRPGDFCGEELLAWALLPNASNFPSSTRTVKALEEVEAFSLQAEDLKFVANQFRRLHSKKLQHTFRYYSHHWRTWGACFIQAAWRRFKKRKLAQSLSSRESFSGSLTASSSFSQYDNVEFESQEQAPDDNSGETATPSQAIQQLGVTLLAKRFAGNARKGAQRNRDIDLPKMMKPQDPDFFSEP